MNRPVWILHQPDHIPADPGRLATPDGAPVASSLPGNPLAPGFMPGGVDGAALMWSGTPGDELFEPDFRVWSEPAWSALRDLLARAHAGSVWIRPHSAHVVSDIPSSRRLLAEPGASLLLDGASMITREMAPHAEDHLTRIFQALAGWPGVGAVLLAGVGESDGAPGGWGACSLSSGVVPEASLVALLDACVPPQTPVVLLEADADRASSLALRGSIG